MPQASDVLHAKMKEYFGEVFGEGGDDKVIAYLRSVGLDYGKGFVWIIPHDKAITSKELNCLYYLVDEWDFDYKWEGVVR